MTGAQCQPVKQSHVHERVVQKVRLTEDQVLQPRDRRPSESYRARLIGVSRPSLREALEALGHLEIHHGGGVSGRYPDLTVEALRAGVRVEQIRLRDLFTVRKMLELPAARWAALKSTTQQASNLDHRLMALAREAASPKRTTTTYGSLTSGSTSTPMKPSRTASAVSHERWRYSTRGTRRALRRRCRCQSASGSSRSSSAT